MRKRIGRPSPALAISLIALFVALGGSGYAAVKLNGKNIKNKTIAGKALKNKTITGAKVKGNTLTGRQIRESSLATVPSATNATNATNAVNATNAANATTVSGVRHAAKRVVATPGADFEAARIAAPEVPLFSAGPFTVYGKCMTDASGPATLGYVFIKTSENNALLSSPFISYTGAPLYLSPATNEIQRFVNISAAGANSAGASPPNIDQFAARSQSGVVFEATTAAWVKNGTLAGGDGPYGAGDVCLFSGTLNQTS